MFEEFFLKFPNCFALNALYLFSYGHERIKEGNGLRNKSHLLTADFFYLLLCKFFSFVIEGAACFCIIRENPHDRMGKETFPGTAGTYDSENFSFF